MDVKDAIVNRKSVRKYLEREVPMEVLKELIEAARLAPSGNNAQPWMFKIVIESTQKEKLRTNEVFKQNFVYNSPVIIVCCANPEAYPRAKFEPDFDDSFEIRAIRDLSIASQNLVLRATELGLGTCYVGWLNKKKIKEVLEIPGKYKVPYVITVGYPEGQPKQSIRKSLKDLLL